MDKWGVEIDLSASNSIFLCFIEPWELEAIKKQSAANEFRLIQKYKVYSSFMMILMMMRVVMVKSSR